MNNQDIIQFPVFFSQPFHQYFQKISIDQAGQPVGCEAYYTGRYDDARARFLSVLDDVKDRTDEPGRLLKSKALARLSNVAIAGGNLDQATAYLGQLKSVGPHWRDRIYAAHWIQRINRMQHRQEEMKKYGVMAVNALLDPQTNR